MGSARHLGNPSPHLWPGPLLSGSSHALLSGVTGYFAYSVPSSPLTPFCLLKP